MSFSARLDRLHRQARQNRWLGLFAVFNRVALAAGFLPAGYVKINGERFTDLHNLHPLGGYLEALFHTGYYYTFIGVAQVTAAVLLLIPRTATLGAVLYLPIIVNICILSFAVRFQGSLLTAPLMILANLYLLCWDCHKFRLVFPWNHDLAEALLPAKEELTWRFPWKFVLGVVATVVVVFASVVFVMRNALMPMNRITDCRPRCAGSTDPGACLEFCECVHTRGETLDDCLEAYGRAVE
ncbi:DoxX family protein [Neolewinella litorea]|uniref:DoxX family protein n=1 Tax=Neolewinella litorea TaxID=2562452 RepID=A0A4S4NEE7_9BACT|nr:DoxX family protein [Neolewinella litorea]THH37904.1 DoxX family protein [Neolewinella litorea]